MGIVGLLSIVFAPPLHAAVEENVTHDHDADWHMKDTPCAAPDTGNQTFEPGPISANPDPNQPPGPPRGSGSLHFTIGPNAESREENRNTRYGGMALSDLIELTYWTYVTTPGTPTGYTPAVFVGLDLDLTNDGRTQVDDTLIFEPSLQSSPSPVVIGRWQQWSAHGAGRWYFSQSGTPAPLSQWITTFPDAKIVDSSLTVGGVFLGAGCRGTGSSVGWAGFNGYTDAFSIRFRDDTDATIFDMDPPDPQQPRSLNCEPEFAVVRSGGSHSIVCTVSGDPGAVIENVEVDVEVTGVNDPDGTDGYSPRTPDLGGSECRTGENGSCSITHGGSSKPTTEAGITTYRAWIDDDKENKSVEADPDEGRNELDQPGSRPDSATVRDNTDVVEVRWSAAQVECDPETTTVQTGGSHTITCLARDAAGSPTTGAVIDIEATGVNDPDGNSVLTSPDFTCTTGTLGTCPVTHAPGGTRTTNTVGRTTYRAWIDADGFNSTAEADTAEGRDELTTPGAREPDPTEVVEANWSTTGASATPTATTCPTATPTPTGSPTSSPSPTPTGSPTSSPSPTPTQAACPTPTPTPTRTPTPTPTPTRTPPDREPLTRGPCAGFFPNSRTDRANGGEVIVGTTGNDQINGSSRNDLICSLGGNDTVRAMGGSDEVYSGRGEDTIRSGRGNDVGNGGRHDDLILGAPGNDQLRGGAGRDDLRGGRGDDTIDGGSGRDSCLGGTGNDRLTRCE